MCVRDVFIVKKVDGDIGLEIEVEGYDLPTGVPGWREEEDGSLQEESIEYVLEKPSDLNTLRLAIDTLNERFIEASSKIKSSVRGGVHVHVNVQELTMTQVASFTTLYFILESLLVNKCGETRVGNHFCLRSQDAPYNQILIRKAFVEREWYLLENEDIRYSSLNMCALPKFGSMEFRAMRSTLDVDDLMLWAETLLFLREKSKMFKSPGHIMAGFSRKGVVDFVKDVLGPFFIDYTHKVEGWQQMVIHDMRHAQLFAFCTDWDNLEVPKREVKKSLQELELELDEVDVLDLVDDYEEPDYE